MYNDDKKKYNNIMKKVQVTVIGAGPAGVSAAITLAKAGIEVLLVERGDCAGDKNVFGGTIYAMQTSEIFPEFWKEAPVERAVSSQKIMLLTDDQSTEFLYRYPIEENYKAFTVNRSKWDKWCVNQAVNSGAYYAPKTLVKELIVENGFVKGVRTQFEEFYSDIVIIADGVNSLLAKQIGLRNKFKDSNVTLNVKEVYRLPKERLQDRFNLKDNEGFAAKIFGGPLKDIFAMGFMYTNKDSVTIGLGITLNDLVENNYRPFEILEQLKSHPTIAPLIKGGELKEYSAHLIPEGGYKKIPKLCGNGVMIIGDAAMLVNNLHWEGTNLAMISGKLAAQTAIEALNCENYSKKFLSAYEKNLKNSFIMKDLKTYKDLMNVMHQRKKAFLDYYLRKINSFFEMFTSVNSIPKKKNYWDFIASLFTDRKISELFKDMWALIKLLWSILI